jgi:cell division protein YceG involved in septum cleavage
MARPASVSRTPPPPAKGAAQRSQRLMVTGIILAILAFGCGFGTLTVQADLSQPVATRSAPFQSFVVSKGDTVNTIAANLESHKLIRNALFFKLYLKLKNLQLNAVPGTYPLSAGMTMQQIILVLNTPPPQVFVQFTVTEGSRLTQYPGEIQSSASDPKNPHPGTLPNFDPATFLNITVKGQTFDGEDKYWYVKPWDISKAGGSLTALEGYLAPNTYYVDPNADTVTIIKTMLNGFGEELCPGPANNPDEFILDQTQCMANQATITVPTLPAGIAGAGTKIGVFDALKKNYGATDIVKDIQQALTIGSFAQREARHPEHFFLVASVYYNSFKNIDNPGGTNGLLSADPAEQYWLGHLPGATDPWPQLATALPGVTSPADPSVPNNPYNLYKNPGLSPSAIAGVSADALYGGFDPPKTNYYYFFFGKDCTNHYYPDYTSFQNGETTTGVDTGQCG